MSVVERCRVVKCPAARSADALVCGEAGRGHLADLFAGRLVRLADGSFRERVALTGRAA